MTPESWLQTICDAQKTAIIQNGARKIHFLLKDGREMVEEYNLDTNVVTRRAWKKKTQLGQDLGWSVEIGLSEPKSTNIEMIGIEESSSEPTISRRNTKRSLEWRIRNLMYPKNVYSVTVERDNTITIRTSNKKYFKRIEVPDFERIGLKLEQDRLSFMYQFNTLIITYAKPPIFLDMERKILEEIMKLDVQTENVQCPVS